MRQHNEGPCCWNQLFIRQCNTVIKIKLKLQWRLKEDSKKQQHALVIGMSYGQMENPT